MSPVSDMVNSGKAAFFLMLLFFPFFSSGYSSDEIDPRALKVLRLIEKIEGGRLYPANAPLRRADVSESELNAYIAHRIETEEEEIMKELELKLLAKNRIEGRVLIDLSGRRIPAGLHPRMNLYFSARILTKEQKVRLKMENLYLEQQKIQPALLDLIIFVVSQFEKTEPAGIEDWVDLPFGIKNMETEAGKLIVLY